jgi:hypothetical protein
MDLVSATLGRWLEGGLIAAAAALGWFRSRRETDLAPVGRQMDEGERPSRSALGARLTVLKRMPLSACGL